MNELTPAAIVASRLASSMLGLLSSSVNSPIEGIVREGLLADDAILAEIFQRDFARIEPGDHRQVATFVSSYVRHIMAKATREVRDDLDGARFP